MNGLNFEIFSDHHKVPVQTFRGAVDNALYLLNQFDAGISKKSRGILDWYVDKLSSNGNGNDKGAFSIHFMPYLKRSQKASKVPTDIAPRVTHEFIEGVGSIETKCETPPYLSEHGLERVGKLADLIHKDSATKFKFTAQNQSIEVTHKTSENIRKLLPTSRTAYGSIEGRLEGISVHRIFKGILYHAITNKVVTCLFSDEQFNEIKEALGKRVVVSGELEKNINGDTIRIKNPIVEVVEGHKRFSLPSERNSARILKVPTFANTRSTAEYMRRIRGG